MDENHKIIEFVISVKVVQELQGPGVSVSAVKTDVPRVPGSAAWEYGCTRAFTAEDTFCAQFSGHK